MPTAASNESGKMIAQKLVFPENTKPSIFPSADIYTITTTDADGEQKFVQLLARQLCEKRGIAIVVLTKEKALAYNLMDRVALQISSDETVEYSNHSLTVTVDKYGLFPDQRTLKIMSLRSQFVHSQKPDLVYILP